VLSTCLLFGRGSLLSLTITIVHYAITHCRLSRKDDIIEWLLTHARQQATLFTANSEVQCSVCTIAAATTPLDTVVALFVAIIEYLHEFCSRMLNYAQGCLNLCSRMPSDHMPGLGLLETQHACDPIAGLMCVFSLPDGNTCHHHQSHRNTIGLAVASGEETSG
jgi:hypothetical protein